MILQEIHRLNETIWCGKYGKGKSTMKDVMILTGAGQIGTAIARRMGYGMKIVIGDRKPENAETISKKMNEA